MDVHKGRESSTCERMWTGGGGQNSDFLVDVINGLLLYGNEYNPADNISGRAEHNWFDSE